MKDFIYAVWSGLQLLCPACRQGKLFQTRTRLNRTCPHCGLLFQQASDADWLVSWINAYALLSVVLVGLIVVLHIYTDLGLWTQVAISAAVSTAVLAVAYPNVKGFSVGILYFMRSRWRE